MMSESAAGVAAAEGAPKKPVWRKYCKKGYRHIDCALVETYTSPGGETFRNVMVYKGQVQKRTRDGRPRRTRLHLTPHGAKVELLGLLKKAGLTGDAQGA